MILWNNVCWLLQTHQRAAPHVSIPCLAGRNPPVSMSGPCSRSFPSASRRCSSAMMPHKSLASKSSSTNSTRCSRTPSVRRRARALERHDVDLPHVFIDAEKHHRAYRCEKTYLCAVGPVTAMRTLYRARPGERAVAAMERKVGIVEGYWTPHAARQGAMLTAHLVPREAEEVLGVLGNMTPLEELAGPTAQGALGALGGAAPPVRGEGARGDARGRGHGVHRGGLARRGDGADEDGGRRVPGGELRLGVVV